MLRALTFASAVLASGGLGAQQSPPETMNFKDALLDGQQLAKRKARVRLEGAYIGLAEDTHFLYPLGEKISESPGDAVLLSTASASRKVKELLYDCRKRQSGAMNESACSLVITGRFGYCYFMFPGNNVPCVLLDAAEPIGRTERRQQTPPAKTAPPVSASAASAEAPSPLTCSSTNVVDRAVEVINEGLDRWAPRLVALDATETKSFSGRRVECRALGLFTDLEKRYVTYAFSEPW